MRLRNHKPHKTINLQGQDRHLLVTVRSVRLARRYLGGEDPRQMLHLQPKDPDVVCCCAAAALNEDLGDKVDPNTVEEWISHEPAKFLELASKTVAAYQDFYEVLGLIEPKDPAPQVSFSGGASSPEKPNQ